MTKEIFQGLCEDVPHTTVLTDGSFDFSGGVNSSKVTTLQSQLVPNGLARNELAWLVNAGVRDGGILQRYGWSLNGPLADGTELFQGWYLYEPIDESTPYVIASIGGYIIRYDIDTAQVTDLSAAFGIVNPANIDQAFFCQGEEFLIIQAGDGVTLPLFWDGSTLRRSNGITGNTSAPNINEIPAATCMEYYMGRLWYAQGRLKAAGDIVKGPSGTAQYSRRDSILKVTENPLCIGGDGFSLPSNAGNIRALKAEVNLDAALGEGRLLSYTRKAVYGLTVPVTRSDWTGADTNNMPLDAVVQTTNGAVSDRSVVVVNGDQFYQSLEPAIRSLVTATRYFTQWGNKSISNNENRILKFNDRSLMRFSTGITFGNRLLQAVLPRQTFVGVVHQAILPLDFDAISSMEATLGQSSGASSGYPVWEGHHEGLGILQLATGDFGGRQRAFAAAVSELDGTIQVWELTDYLTSDMNAFGEARVSWQVEFPAFTWGKEFELKELQAMEVWLDKVYGTVEVTAYYRPDADACWHLWGYTTFCAARTCEESVNTPCAYPIEPLSEGYKFPIGFGKPKDVCSPMMKRPSDVAFQFQVKLVIRGWMRIRGLLLYASARDQELYANMSLPSYLPSYSTYPNTYQSCTITCPDGSSSTGIVFAGQYTGITQAEADRVAQKEACVQASAKCPRISSITVAGGGGNSL